MLGFSTGHGHRERYRSQLTVPLSALLFFFLFPFRVGDRCRCSFLFGWAGRTPEGPRHREEIHQTDEYDERDEQEHRPYTGDPENGFKLGCHRGAAGAYSGMFPCFFGIETLCLSRRNSRADATRARVSRG